MAGGIPELLMMGEGMGSLQRSKVAHQVVLQGTEECVVTEHVCRFASTMTH